MGNSFVAEWGSSIEFGDCLEIMRNWPDQCVQMCVTSPPYWGLRDYGVAGQLGLESTPQEYVYKMVAVFREVRRVLRDDGTLWLNLGDSYAANRTYQVHNTKGAAEHTYAPGSSVPDGLKPKDLVGIPWRVAFALQADGWYLRQDIIWRKPNPMPESVRDRCTKSHEYLFLLAKSERYYFDADAIQEASVTGDMRKPYAPGQVDARGDGHDRNGGTQRKVRSPAGWKTGPGAHGSIHDEGREQEITYAEIDSSKRNKRDVWTDATQPFKEAHFATFPPALIEPCILAGSKPGDAVLDPFMGSGTTAMVAQRHGRKYRGCELQENYRDLQVARIGAPKTADLFGNT